MRVRRPAVPASYRPVLYAPGGARMVAASVVARLPLGMVSLAILQLVESHTDSYAKGGLAVALYTLTAAFAGPVLGRLVDRFGQPRVLLPCAAAEAVALVVMVGAAAAGAAGGVLIALSVPVGALMPPVGSSVRAVWTVRFSDDGAARESAFALDSFLTELVYVLGPGLVGALTLVGSSDLALLACAAFLFLAVAVYVGAPLVRDQRGATRDQDLTRPLASPGIRPLLLSTAFAGAALGTTVVGITALSEDLGSDASAGLALGLWSLGGGIVGFAYGARAWAARAATRYRLWLLAFAVATAPLALTSSLALALVLITLSGIPISIAFICQASLVSERAPAGGIAETFTWSTAALATGAGLGQIATGSLVEGTSPGAAFLLAAGAALVALALPLGAHVSRPVVAA